MGNKGPGYVLRSLLWFLASSLLCLLSHWTAHCACLGDCKQAVIVLFSDLVLAPLLSFTCLLPLTWTVSGNPLPPPQISSCEGSLPPSSCVTSSSVAAGGMIVTFASPIHVWAHLLSLLQPQHLSPWLPQVEGRNGIIGFPVTAWAEEASP